MSAIRLHIVTLRRFRDRGTVHSQLCFRRRAEQKRRHAIVCHDKLALYGKVIAFTEAGVACSPSKLIVHEGRHA